MGLSQRPLQTNGKLFSNFEFKFIKLQCVISMDSSQQALQTNGKLFQFSESFFELTTFLK